MKCFMHDENAQWLLTWKFFVDSYKMEFLLHNFPAIWGKHFRIGFSLPVFFSLCLCFSFNAQYIRGNVSPPTECTRVEALIELLIFDYFQRTQFLFVVNFLISFKMGPTNILNSETIPKKGARMFMTSTLQYCDNNSTKAAII